jgi:hypothetical protein
MESDVRHGKIGWENGLGVPDGPSVTATNSQIGSLETEKVPLFAVVWRYFQKK